MKGNVRRGNATAKSVRRGKSRPGKRCRRRRGRRGRRTSSWTNSFGGRECYSQNHHQHHTRTLGPTPLFLTTTPPRPPSPPPPPPPPPQQRNSRVSEGNVNDQDQDFQRQLALVQEEKAEDHKRRSQRACQHRLLVRLLVLLLLLLLCFVLGVLPQHYFPMDVSTEIFPTRAFQMGVSGVHAGVWGVLTEKFHSSKLMGLYGAARDVPPLFLI